ncbi:hypothetical protein [Erythrobacter donghaensis]|uniref:hypothetical protein n=1 Tax=Erythrobacter donghaensis TaxID=267135 RepID=UPI000A38D157|nr:hypothetical protein [Erythrobacter donghaensis]
MTRARHGCGLALAALGLLTACWQDYPALRHQAQPDRHVFTLVENDRPVTRCLTTLTVNTISPRYFADRGKSGLAMTDYVTQGPVTVFDRPRCLRSIAFVRQGDAFLFDGIALPPGPEGGFLVAVSLKEGGFAHSDAIALSR